MDRILTYTVDDTHDNLPLNSVLRNVLKLSGTLIKRIKNNNGALQLNACPARLSDRVHTGDQISVCILRSNAKQTNSCAFDILYEDIDLLIINKPAGIAVHDSPFSHDEKTVCDLLQDYVCGEFHPINRLDRCTSGAMMLAKNGYMHDRMKNLLHTDSFVRKYIGIATGIVLPTCGNITLPIARDENSPIKRIVSEQGKPSETVYETICNTANYTELLLMPKTGRTHQLRLHMSAIGYPLVGDFLYGTEDRCIISRPALHSFGIDFLHPLSQERIVVSCPLPDDMQRLLI